ncbi:mRNA 3' end processing factor [Tilletia horrida]|nr:mRNA 3' end processing factor [Tilletia horrida]KAK0570212.1 mRNA 3' end processing factor [Tilletia horrida]
MYNRQPYPQQGFPPQHRQPYAQHQGPRHGHQHQYAHHGHQGHYPAQHQQPVHHHAAPGPYQQPAPAQPPQMQAQGPPPGWLPHPMIAHDPPAFEQMFKDQLGTLVVNSKPIITHLTVLANDHVVKMSHIISNVIERHIFSAPIPMRLPALYLVDSISKNIGQPYTSHWSGIITRLYLETYRVVDAPTRKRLEELLATWRHGGQNGQPLFGESAQWTIERSLYGTQQNPQGLAQQLAAKDNEAIRSPMAMHGHSSQPQAGPSSHAANGYRSPAYHGQGAVHGAGASQIHQHQSGRAGQTQGPGSTQLGHQTQPSATAANDLISTLLQAGLISQSTKASTPVHDAEQDDDYVRAIIGLDLNLGSGPSDWVKSVQTQMQMQGQNSYNPLELVLHQKAMPASCKQCANRYSSSKAGRRALEEHLDWHFRQNRRAKDSVLRGQSRSWFTDLEVWVRSGFDDSAPSSSKAGGGVDGFRTGRTAEEEAALRARYQATIVVAPTDAEVAAKPCPICKEKFQSEWSEDEEDWIWRNAVLVDGIYYHASCHASAKTMSQQVARGGTPEVKVKSPCGSDAGSQAATPTGGAIKDLPSADPVAADKVMSDPVGRVKAEEGVGEAVTNPRKRKGSPSGSEPGGEGGQIKKERLGE